MRRCITSQTHCPSFYRCCSHLVYLCVPLLRCISFHPNTSSMSIHAFANNPLDRCNNFRTQEGYIEGLITAPTTKFIPFNKLNPLIDGFTSKNKVMGCRNYENIKTQIEAKAKQSVVYLGIGKPELSDSESAFFAVDVSDLPEETLKQLTGDSAQFADLRQNVSFLPSTHAGVLAQGRAVLEWHRKTQFCGKCGTKTTSLVAGTKRVCPSCNESHYPRTDPVIIVLVAKGDKILLSKSPRYPGKVYTCVAGFIEPGESLEEAARREVKEETGIELGKVTYHSSQPWPFLGGQLMIGMVGEATSDTITIDPKEVEDAQWFTKKDVTQMIERSANGTIQDIFQSKELITPPPLAIAHHLIKHWISSSNM